jgi:hypothetical protein
MTHPGAWRPRACVVRLRTAECLCPRACRARAFRFRRCRTSEQRNVGADPATPFAAKGRSRTRVRIRPGSVFRAPSPRAVRSGAIGEMKVAGRRPRAPAAPASSGFGRRQRGQAFTPRSHPCCEHFRSLSPKLGQNQSLVKAVSVQVAVLPTRVAECRQRSTCSSWATRIPT